MGPAIQLTSTSWNEKTPAHCRMPQCPEFPDVAIVPYGDGPRMRCDNIEKERQDQRTPPKQNLRLLFGESFSKLLNQIEDNGGEPSDP